jgi:hypothetical protein
MPHREPDANSGIARTTSLRGRCVTEHGTQ